MKDTETRSMKDVEEEDHHHYNKDYGQHRWLWPSILIIGAATRAHYVTSLPLFGLIPKEILIIIVTIILTGPAMIALTIVKQQQPPLLTSVIITETTPILCPTHLAVMDYSSSSKEVTSGEGMGMALFHETATSGTCVDVG